ncbi:cyclophilin-like protein [Hymenopellis radicata]|nr:cyclophilin-like protein [Hymenopellis radicata]
MALPTNGRVIIDTTETPKTCRNFLALAMEGLVVPGFLVQTGDRTGTGAGGNHVFEDEIHPRLRFAHRGLVAMANNGTKNSNDSQFIITLDRADELHGKHTLFGRCVGDTVYNVMKIGEMEIGEDERPVYPPKIRGIRILENPFDDIVPRITAEEKRAQQRAKEQSQREREEMERRKGAKKNVQLLSFDDEEGQEVVFKKKTIVRPDLQEDPEPVMKVPDFVTKPPMSSKAASDKPAAEKPKKKAADDLTKIREQHAKSQTADQMARKTEIEKMEADIRKLNKKRDGNDSDDEPSKKKAKRSYLEEELSKYSKGRGLHKKGKKKDEGDVLAALNSFRGALQNTMALDDDEPAIAVGEGGDGGNPPVGEEDPGMEVDDDIGFLSHALHFPKDDGEESRKAERDYEVIDPRARKAIAMEEERERKRAMRSSKGMGDGSPLG